MKIFNLRSEERANRTAILASISWEDSDRKPQEVFFETNKQFSDALSDNPHPFLVGAIVPAFHHGEKRIYVDGEVCPELMEGLITVLSWFRHWYGPPRNLPKIEPKSITHKPNENKQKHSGLFFSGGIDSLALLRSNRLNYSLEHPRSFHDGIIIYGQNIESDTSNESFDNAVNALSEVTQDAQLNLIPVFTNIRGLDYDTDFFINQFHSAVLGAVAHSLSSRLSSVSISSSDSIPALSILGKTNLKPFGSHPLIDPNYSSSGLAIRHEGITLSRLDKTGLVVGWDVALQNIKVCQPNWPGDNCCKCEKCIRTMLALSAFDVLDKTRAFSQNVLSEQDVLKIKIKKPVLGDDSYSVDDDYLELIGPLKNQNRNDLAQAVEKLIERYNYRESSLKAFLKKVDKKVFNGNLTKHKKRIIPQR